MASLTWTCPNCRRRVPTRVDACHCGTTRSQAEQLAAASPQGAGPGTGFGYPAERAEMGWDVKGPALGLVLVAVLAAGWLVFRPYRPDPIVPVLGFVDQNRTPPTTLSARRPAPPPLFKLPWWK